MVHPDLLIHKGALNKAGRPKGGVAAPSIKENTLEGIQAIADYLGKSYSTIHKWIKYHNLPAMISPNGEWFTTKAAVHAWIIATGSEDVRRMNLNPFDIPASVEERFSRGSATIHDRINIEKQSALEFLYGGRIRVHGVQRTQRNRLISEVA
ncbi:MAG: hypothetical protein L0Y56_22830 [Nitrospira sp.]|nr:hypothetical protein [Nitrospira sp.]